MREIKLSFSAWARFKNCPRSYKLRYVDRVPAARFDNWYTVIGTVPGRQAEAFYRLPPEERALGFFEATFDDTWRQAVEKSNDPQSGSWIDWSGRGAKLVPGVPEEEAFRKAYLDRLNEARECSRRLAALIDTLGLLRVKAEPELGFEVRVAPEERNADQPWAPLLVLHGYIDLLIHRDDGVEVWDWKTTKNPSKLDRDQLAIYTMAVQHGGANVLGAGYLLIKQGRAEKVNVTSAQQYDLCRKMRQMGVCFATDTWPTNPVRWVCQSCDVASFCPDKAG